MGAVCLSPEQIERREKIKAFEDEIKKRPQVEDQTTLKHFFLDGLYLRQITIPAHVALTGKIHRQQTMNMITRGKIIIYTEHDEQIITAPFMYISQAATKKACYTLEETTIINGHMTHETDLKKIELLFTMDDYPKIEG